MSEKVIRVIFSSDAYNTILTETYHKDPSETGGILLGNSEEDNWYVIDCIEPGPGSVFKSSYFEYDTAFVNYLAKARARRYHMPLRVLGLWHRHPGSFDRFSSTDNETNLAFAGLSERGSLSGLVNLDPEFRFTLFHFDKQLKYKKVSYLVSDKEIPGKFLCKKFENLFFTDPAGPKTPNHEVK
jgi:proteasome lid subunit RPN8/RPN11